ncbi:OsmC family protein [Variovorax terrae]|uniref:OsmC family protein n=1 Tax=Variovorax terrae TaxID=2923278 RepID=A0A9X1VZV0_9BURK|nr:OsmC family protein [Variovorax terrae]MCJ0763508.1 OsmC family protein [Variovorax terrae]
MTIVQIQQSIEGVIKLYSEHPEKALSTDKAAVAVIQEGLRCKAEGPNGAVLVSDMPKGIGGGGTAPTPGWFLRAALANCDATVIAMRAAQLGIVLTKLEVTVDSDSDSRGILGVGDSVPAGPLNMRVHVLVAADGASPEQLRQIVAWAESHSPVGDALRRAIPCSTEVEVA